MEFNYQTYSLGVKENVQRGCIIDDDFFPVDDFDDGPLRIEEIEDDQPEVEVKNKTTGNFGDKPVDPSDLSTWAQDLLDLMDNSISQLESLKIKKNRDFDGVGEKSSKEPVLEKSKGFLESKDESEDENDEIENCNDEDVLNEMLNTSYEYETRRRIRTRIRALRKINEEKNSPQNFNPFPPKSRQLAIPLKSPSDEGYVSFSSPISPIQETFAAKMGDRYVNGVDLEDIEDEIQLHDMLDKCEDIDERKMIRQRLRDVMSKHRAEREEMIRKREQDREDLLRKRVADSDEHKRRTLAMYDAMAKSAPAGANKNIDISILRTGVASAQPVQAHQTLDLVEEAIRERQRNSDENKRRTLAAFDRAAKSSPAGMARIVDFDNITNEDINRSLNVVKPTATFEMKGGIPSSSPVVAPKVMPRKVEPQRDLMEESIRKRKAEADERKRRTLAAYDSAARSRPAGLPVSVYIPSTEGIDPVITVVERPKFGSRPNTPTIQQQQQQQQQPQQQQQQPSRPVWKPPGQQQQQQQPPIRPGWKPPSPQPQQQQQQPQQQQPARPGWRPGGQQQQPQPQPQMYRPQSPQTPQSPQSPQPTRPQWYKPPQQQINRPQPLQRQQEVPSPPPGRQPQPQAQMYKPQPQPMNRPQPLQQQPNQQQQQANRQMNIKTQSIRTVSNPYENNVQNASRTITTTTKKTVAPVQVQQRQMVTTTTRTVTQQQQQQQQQQQRRYYEEDDEEEEEEEETEEEESE